MPVVGGRSRESSGPAEGEPDPELRRTSSNAMELERFLKVSNKYGLHARASTRLAQTASQFQATVFLCRKDGDEEVDAKSILGILTLGAERGQVLRVRAAGDDAARALEAIAELFERNFDET